MQKSHETKYYYFNPLSKQCYFPEGFKKYPLFATFYQPYRLSAKFLWKLWLHVKPFRYLFSNNHPENILPLKQIDKYVPKNSIMAFNMGTKGVEQKITIIGIDPLTKIPFFIKYGASELARTNIHNEGKVLKQLSHLDFVSKLDLDVNNENEFALIKTSVLQGAKMDHQFLDDQILSILYKISEQQIDSDKRYNSNLKTSFAHGDFCPWNMLTYNGKIQVYDWELAGTYPAGYDLFTFIFQYEILVNGNTHFDIILEKNAIEIEKYFAKFQINDWNPYLQKFADLKYKTESAKCNKDLIKPYMLLKEYVSGL